MQEFTQEELKVLKLGLESLNIPVRDARLFADLSDKVQGEIAKLEEALRVVEESKTETEVQPDSKEEGEVPVTTTEEVATV